VGTDIKISDQESLIFSNIEVHELRESNALRNSIFRETKTSRMIHNAMCTQLVTAHGTFPSQTPPRHPSFSSSHALCIATNAITICSAVSLLTFISYYYSTQELRIIAHNLISPLFALSFRAIRNTKRSVSKHYVMCKR